MRREREKKPSSTGRKNTDFLPRIHSLASLRFCRSAIPCHLRSPSPCQHLALPATLQQLNSRTRSDSKTNAGPTNLKKKKKAVHSEMFSASSNSIRKAYYRSLSYHIRLGSDCACPPGFVTLSTGVQLDKNQLNSATSVQGPLRRREAGEDGAVDGHGPCDGGREALVERLPALRRRFPCAVHHPGVQSLRRVNVVPLLGWIGLE